jgi:UDP-2,3-diacylglucosamine hydrolase
LSELARGKKVYFASDSHFGVPSKEKSLERERLFIKWLDEIKEDAAEIYLMGDLFEFWFEYKTVIQKGYVRLFGKLAEISDSGIPVCFFRGNHDVWAFDYFEKELNIKIYPDSLIKEIGNKTFFLGHGDGLGKGDNGYKFLKKVFRNRFNQWLFRWVHPDIGTAMGLYWTEKSRAANVNKGLEEVNRAGIERISGFCRSMIEKGEKIDYFIFGHIHKPNIEDINGKAKYFSIGDWITNFSYVVFDGEKVELKYYKQALNMQN